MNIERFVIEVNKQGASQKLSAQKLTPQSPKTQTLWMSQKHRPSGWYNDLYPNLV